MKIRARRRSLLLALGLFAAACCGCATRGGENPLTKPWPIARVPKTGSLSVVFAGSLVYNDDLAELGAKQIAAWYDVVKRAYSDSGLFSVVYDESMESHLRVEVWLHNVSSRSRALDVMNGASFEMIPTRSLNDFVMRTQFKDSRGNVLATIEKHESLTLWSEFFLYLVPPYNDPIKAGNVLVRDLARATVAEAHAKGII